MNCSLHSRRSALQTLSCGFGALALAGITQQQTRAALSANPLAPRAPHFKPRAKRIIFLFMSGGVSHVDSFDHKPRLTADDGKMMDFADLRALAKTGKSPQQRVMKPLWNFAQHGQSGHWASDLFPEMAKHMDDLCLIRSMHTEGIAHGHEFDWAGGVQGLASGTRAATAATDQADLNGIVAGRVCAAAQRKASHQCPANCGGGRSLHEVAARCAIVFGLFAHGQSLRVEGCTGQKDEV